MKEAVNSRGPQPPPDSAAPPSVRPSSAHSPASWRRGFWLRARARARAAPAPGQLALPDVEAAHIGAGEAETREHGHPAAQTGAWTAQSRRLGLPLRPRHRQQAKPVPAQRRHRAPTRGAPQ